MNQAADNLADQQAFAEQVLRVEADAVARVPIGQPFHDAVALIASATGPDRTGSVVVSGLGKSGLIGRKISATFSSTGTPSHFLHPTEALHGDLGRVRRDDVVLLLSFRGGTEETLALASILKVDQVPVIAMVGKAESDLGRLAAITMPVGDIDEACPMNLAPTASTTAMLALGDALALCVMRQRPFGAEDFRKVHPGGGLGRQLMTVAEAMRFRTGANLPLIPRHVTVQQAYAQVESHAAATGLRRAGAVLIIDDDGTLAGIFTDGDLRRSFIRHGKEAWLQPIERHMTARPTVLPADALVRDAVQLVREHRWDEIPVVDSTGKPVGLIDVQDLVALKVIAG